MLLTAVSNGFLPECTRYISNGRREKVDVRNGSVFVWSETAGMKRWTDGKRWKGSCADLVRGGMRYEEVTHRGKTGLIKNAIRATSENGKRLNLVLYYDSIHSLETIDQDPSLSEFQNGEIWTIEMNEQGKNHSTG